MYERGNPLGSLNSFLSYAPQRSRAKSCFLIVYVLDSLFTLRGGRYDGWQLLASPPSSFSSITMGGDSICRITGIVFPFGRPYSHLKAWNHWLLLHSCLLIWQEVSYFKTESSYWLINWVLMCGQITQKKKGNTYGNDCLLDYFFLLIYRN